MKNTTIIQGRETTYKDIELAKKLIAANPDWHRSRLSQELCKVWNWRNSNNQLKDMACRTFLRKLEQCGYLTLPERRKPGGSTFNQSITIIPHKSEPIAGDLKYVAPVTVEQVKRSNLGLFKCLINNYHYLGFRVTVGQNMKYMVFDKNGNPLSCLLFGSAAWKCAPRDKFIGWSQRARETNINLVTNNMRFLVLPWVKVSHLASHILGQVAKRISSDWEEKYGHPVYLLETFVEKDRFPGTCYRAANWTSVGETTGRSRNDRYGTLKVPVKDIFLYPLTKNFREVLCHEV